jgi:hypothetical protein
MSGYEKVKVFVSDLRTSRECLIQSGVSALDQRRF